MGFHGGEGGSPPHCLHRAPYRLLVVLTVICPIVQEGLKIFIPMLLNLPGGPKSIMPSLSFSRTTLSMPLSCLCRIFISRYMSFSFSAVPSLV